jgi:hypothetical protein
LRPSANVRTTRFNSSIGSPRFFAKFWELTRFLVISTK